MRLTALPPVRRAVPLRRGTPADRDALERFFGNRRITLYASGTAALAQAIAQCAAKSSASAPEVIIPAYGCPDLVAACLYAAVYPRLVDIASSHWAYDLEALHASLSPNTVAIVAVNLLGLGDGAGELIRVCRERRIPLIQDSAQFLPREPIGWPGDYVVLSFGRGKPLNLLHGGALVAPAGNGHGLTVRPVHYTARDFLLSTRAAAIAFNLLTRPHLYRLCSMIPRTGLGNVVYTPLDETLLLPEHAWKQVGMAFRLYCQKPSYGREIWESAIEQWVGMAIVALNCPGATPQMEPVRLALLAPDRAARDALVSSLARQGLGASSFYGTDLPGVSGIPDLIKRQGPFPRARALADRLFTLPTHGLVTQATVNSTHETMRAIHRTSSISGRHCSSDSLVP